ncbi:MAG TPA: ABC transporter substrate-binding protein [Chloroflexota bacterium]|jgi:ABC-type nitrate/sulfonate/bicarbonate transport system substrate-binding protein|nr:ABC transporter substrate-binding protein [Chloroflexota bacterium]
MPVRVDRRRFLALAGLGGALALSACSGARGTPAAEPASQGGAGATAPSGQPTKVTLATIRGIFDQAYLLAAIDAGIYARDGIDLELVGFQDDVAATRALIAGEVLVYDIAPARPLSAIEQGTALKALGVTYARLPFVILGRKEVASLSALPGKSVAIGAPGDLNDQIVRALFRKYQVDANAVSFVPIGPTPQIIQALIAGKVEAGPALFVNEFQVRDNPDLHRLADVSQEFPDWVRFVLFVKQETIERQDALLRRFVLAHSKAWRWALENRDAVIAAATKYLSIPEGLAAAAYDAPFTRPGMITPDFTITAEQMQTVQELNIAAGTQTRLIPFDQLVDLRYVQAVQQELGPYRVPVRGG